MAGPPALTEPDWLTRDRIQRIAGIFVVFAALAFAGDAWIHTQAGVTSTDGVYLGRDFINYWAGAHLAAKDQAARVYDIQGFVAWQRSHTTADAEFKWFSYPPQTLLLSLPLALLSFKAGFLAWLLAGWAACFLLLRKLLDWRMAAVVTFAAPASFINAISGQNGQFSAALLCGGVLMLERSPIIAGILFGSLCFKPQLGIMIPVALAVGGYWRSFASAAFTAFALVATSVVLFGEQTWVAFLHNAPINALLMEHGNGLWHRMPTLFAMARLVGGSIPVAYGLQILSSLAAIWLTVITWRSHTTLARKGAVLVLATILATPYAWDYDLVSLSFVVAWLANDGLEYGFRPWEKSLLALTMITPLFISQLATVSHVQIAPFVLWAMLLFAVPKSLEWLPKFVLPFPGRQSSVLSNARKSGLPCKKRSPARSGAVIQESHVVADPAPFACASPQRHCRGGK